MAYHKDVIATVCYAIIRGVARPGHQLTLPYYQEFFITQDTMHFLIEETKHQAKTITKDFLM